MEHKILDTIHSPRDLDRLSESDLNLLAKEIREFLVESISKTGGHLASNLGVVELTLAIHRVFDSPYDKIVWDVGHQSYVHKILTGRKDQFATLRQEDGLCGFPKAKGKRARRFYRRAQFHIDFGGLWDCKGALPQRRQPSCDLSDRGWLLYRRNGIRGDEQCRTEPE